VSVGDGDDGVVEGRLDVGHTPADVAALFTFLALGHGGCPSFSKDQAARMKDESGRPGLLLSPLILRPSSLKGSILLPGLLDALRARHGLPRALARACVGAGPLAAHRQVAAVADAAVAADLGQPLDVLLVLAAERAFHRVFAVEDVGDAGDLVFVQLL